LKYIW